MCCVWGPTWTSNVIQLNLNRSTKPPYSSSCVSYQKDRQAKPGQFLVKRCSFGQKRGLFSHTTDPSSCQERAPHCDHECNGHEPHGEARSQEWQTQWRTQMHSDLGLVFEGFKCSKCTKNIQASYNADRAVSHFRCGIFLGEPKVIVTPFFQNRDAIICQRAIFVSPPREGGAPQRQRHPTYWRGLNISKMSAVVWVSVVYSTNCVGNWKKEPAE